ncbi:DNA methyltransferase [Micromonospora sp. DT229]|uniref:DNA methyltransferase n=1 Tax=Micromonospora sp. DT229 TaxID=3393430 RepID=UPI003CE6F52B
MVDHGLPSGLSAGLADLVRYRREHLDGDEKGEAQLFLERLFRGFGHAGVREAGASLEYRIKKRDDKGTSFADLMFKPRCLIEMKKAGTPLNKHFRQAFDYWIRAVPDRPHYVVLCNFDEFWIYDFDRQLDAPIDRLKLEDLPQRWESLAFLLPVPQTPIFGNDLVEVTREAAASVAAVFRSMHDRGVDRETAQRFTLQCVMAMFAEDIGLLPSHLFTAALNDSNDGSRAYDLLFGLFREMNTPGTTTGGRFRGTPYFNGGLFSSVRPVEPTSSELDLLRTTSSNNWSAVRPEIFGTLFEQSMSEGERHASGAHFTSQTDIAKIVIPSIVDPWRERIGAAGSIAELERLLADMYNYRVLDPACGSGNFLYVAYREMRRLENEVIQRINERRRNTKFAQRALSYVTPNNFHGMDVNPFAVEVAKVTLSLAKKLAADELGDEQQVLPLDNLDAVIIAGDALFDTWPKADVIIGNPPFLGRRKMVSELGADYCARLAHRHPDVGGVSDFVCYWFPLAHKHLPPGGRAGLVATKSIKQGSGREVTLDYIKSHGGVITEAVDMQPWSGDAAVTVSIVNWIKDSSYSRPGVLWTRNGESRLEVPEINSSLSLNVDLKRAAKLKSNTKPKRVFQGQTPGVSTGFEINEDLSVRLLKADARAGEVIHPFLGGRDLLKALAVKRRIIDVPFGEAGAAWACVPQVMKHLEETVLPKRQEAASTEQERNDVALRRNSRARVNWHYRNFLQQWWRLSYRREEMLEALQGSDRFIAITRTSSELRGPVFTFLDSAVHLGDSGVAFAFDDDYSFGILQASPHVAWFRERCTTLETRLTYTSGNVFDTFPWPQGPSESAVLAVAEAAAAIIEHRAKALGNGVTLAAQYDVLRRPGRSHLRTLHERLDDAVVAAYGFDPEVDLLAQLLSLNLQIAEKEAGKEEVTPPGPPPGVACRVSDWKLPPTIL